MSCKLVVLDCSDTSRGSHHVQQQALHREDRARPRPPARADEPSGAGARRPARPTSGPVRRLRAGGLPCGVGVLGRLSGRAASAPAAGVLACDDAGMEISRPIETWLTDMDGVLVHEEDPIPGATEFVEALKASGK